MDVLIEEFQGILTLFTEVFREVSQAKSIKRLFRSQILSQTSSFLKGTKNNRASNRKLQSLIIFSTIQVPCMILVLGLTQPCHSVS